MHDPKLADVIRQLREELAAAAAEAEQSGPSFLVETAEVELAFVLRDSRTRGGGVKIGFPGLGIDLQGGESGGRDLTHRLKVQLKPAETWRVSSTKSYDPGAGEPKE